MQRQINQDHNSLHQEQEGPILCFFHVHVHVRTSAHSYCSLQPEPIEIDISTLSAEDLQSLKQDDPFLYYSIPVVRRAAFSRDEPDMSPTSVRGSTIVKRRTRVSYECHTDLLMDDLLGDFEDEEYDESALEQIDLDFLKMFGLVQAATQQ